MPGDVGRSGAAGDAPPVPRTLAQALDQLAADDVMRSALGSAILDEFLTIKRSEWDAFITHVDSWDRDWYLGRY